MATGTPLYGKQYIRFAETFQVRDGNEVNQFRVVELDGAGAGDHPPLYVTQGNGGPSLGVSQYLVNDNVPPTGFATDRQRVLTVATSGLLLVQSNGTLTTSNIGSPLYVVAGGLASDAGAAGAAAVTIGGAAPALRDVLSIGAQNYALVSFS